ncbi:MAG: multidrug effflux MFS transporter [Allosphingosinicella sp.]
MTRLDETSAKAGRHTLGRRALVLGLISLSSPLALNMYVPAFPRMAADLGTAPAEIQLSLTSLLVALAIGQNVYGPLSDRFGRKGLLYAGLGLFVAASIAVAQSSSLAELVAWRFVQGFGACAGIAIPRAVVRDLHTGFEAARIMALMLLVISVAPLLAPMVGSALAAAFSWRFIFWFMAGTGALALLLAATMLEETLPRARRTEGGVARMLGGYLILFRDGHFVGLVLMMSLTQAAFFAFLGGSPFVFMTLFGMDGWQYSLMFGGTAAFWALSAQLAPMAMNRLGARRLLIRCAAGNALVSGLLLAASLAGLVGPWAIVAAIIPLFMGAGMLTPTATVTALHRHGALAGTASAVIGTGSFAAGGIASALVSGFADGSELPMVGVMAGCSLLALVSAFLAFAGESGDDDLDQMGYGRSE